MPCWPVHSSPAPALQFEGHGLTSTCNLMLFDYHWSRHFIPLILHMLWIYLLPWNVVIQRTLLQPQQSRSRASNFNEWWYLDHIHYMQCWLFSGNIMESPIFVSYWKVLIIISGFVDQTTQENIFHRRMNTFKSAWQQLCNFIYHLWPCKWECSWLGKTKMFSSNLWHH